MNEKFVVQGGFLREACEWADAKRYDLVYRHGSMADLPEFGLGKFDIVTAFCSVYYLDDAAIRRLLGTIRTITDTMVWQCNVERGIGRVQEDEYKRATVEYAVEVLREAGFTDTQVFAPRGYYSRPLVVARKAAGP